MGLEKTPQNSICPSKKSTSESPMCEHAHSMFFQLPPSNNSNPRCTLAKMIKMVLAFTALQHLSKRLA